VCIGLLSESVCNEFVDVEFEVLGDVEERVVDAVAFVVLVFMIVVSRVLAGTGMLGLTLIMELRCLSWIDEGRFVKGARDLGLLRRC
jgi:hypothetical protein